MTEHSANASKDTARGAGQLLVDLGPIILFVVVYNVLNRTLPEPAEAIYYATGAFIAATLAAIAWAWFKTRRVPPVLIVTGVLVTAFGGLTILLHDENFMKAKPTFVNLFYAGAIFVSLLLKQNIWKLLFGHAFTLPDRIWTTLAVRWGVFFVFMAGVNEYIRLTQTTDFWVNSRIIVVYPLILGFAALNLPLTMKWVGKTNADDPDARAPAAPAATEA
jgi:intracellular septation protein